MKIVKSALVVVYYLFLQVIVSIGLIFWKINTDPDWCDRLLASTGFTDNLALVSDLVLPAVIISDLIIIIPLLFKSKFSMFKKVNVKAGIDFIAIGLACNYVISYVVTYLEKLPIADSYNELINFTLNGDPIFMILSAGILAPFVEELCFRYWMFDIMKGKSDTYKILVTALMFGIAHLNIIQSTYAFIMGLVLGYAYAKTKNLWSSILIHFGMNMSSVLLELLPYTGKVVLTFIFIASLVYVPISLLMKKNVLTKKEFA